MTRKLQIAGLALLLALAAVALFAPTFGFVNLRLDDWGYTAGCPFVKDGLSWANVKGALCDPANGAIWMPLTYVTYMLDISLFGSGWGPHHAVNVALHAVNAMLVFFLLLRLLPKFGCERPASVAAGAFLAALVWLVHPMRVEPVAWIAARKELLWSLFALFGLMAWLGFLERGRRREWTLTFILFLAACLSKPTALCFPLLAFALHRFAAPDGKARFRSYGAFLTVSVVVGALTVFSQMNPTGQAKIDIYDTTLGWRCLNALVSLGLYLWHTVVPTGVHFDYRAVFEGWPLEGTLGLAAVAVVAVALAAFFLRTKDAFARRAAALTVWGFLLPLVPALGVFGIVGDHAYADRYAYLPSVALAFAAGVLLARAAGRKGGVWLSAAIGVLLAAGEIVVAVPMVGTFRNDVTVFSRVLAKDPDHWRALEYVGSEYCARLGRMEEGVAMLRRSYRLSPRPSSAATLAYVLALRGAPGDFAEVRRLGAKVAANPKLDRGGMMLDALGIVAMREADDKAAVRCFSAALVAPKRGHSNVHSLLNLGLCLANTGKDRDALAVLAKLSAVRDEAIRRRAAEAIRAVKSNEPYARFEWKSDARSEAVPAANREETLTRQFRDFGSGANSRRR